MAVKFHSPRPDWYFSREEMSRKKKKSEKYHVANYIYKDFKNCKVRNSFSERVNIAPFPCELKEKFTLSYLGKLILSKYSDAVEFFRMDN